jgi:hypothetical protein
MAKILTQRQSAGSSGTLLVCDSDGMRWCCTDFGRSKPWETAGAIVTVLRFRTGPLGLATESLRMAQRQTSVMFGAAQFAGLSRPRTVRRRFRLYLRPRAGLACKHTTSDMRRGPTKTQQPTHESRAGGFERPRGAGSCWSDCSPIFAGAHRITADVSRRSRCLRTRGSGQGQ